MRLLHRHPDAAPDHTHEGHDHAQVKRRNLAAALAITVIFLVVEVIGAVLTGSLALLADAGHMLTDAAALALALGAGWLAARPATDRRSFGYLRAEILAAALNAAMLIAISIYIFYEAWQRVTDPPEIESGLMLVVAAAGLAANALAAWILSRGGGHSHDLNTRGAFLHVVGDMLGSVGAIAAALVMMATGWYYADPLLSAGIGLLILYGAWRLLRESVEVLLESAPASVDVDAIRRTFVEVKGVEGVHDLHVWTVTSGFVALSAHVEVDNSRQWDELLVELHGLLRVEHGISHLTLQPETASKMLTGWKGCSIDTPVGQHHCLSAGSPVVAAAAAERDAIGQKPAVTKT